LVKKIEGTIAQARGRAQVEIGKVTERKSTELKGRARQAKGKFTEKLG
jgi:uncharacterized protein YjbJ (UPF0337 family)